MTGCGLSKGPKDEAEHPIDPLPNLAEQLSRVGDDRVLASQIALLAQLSLELRLRGYTGHVTLHLSKGVVNSVRQEEWTDWRHRLRR